MEKLDFRKFRKSIAKALYNHRFPAAPIDDHFFCTLYTDIQESPKAYTFYPAVVAVFTDAELVLDTLEKCIADANNEILDLFSPTTGY